MSRYASSIPVGATTVARVEQVIHNPGQPNHGCLAVLRMYRDAISLGYRSNYERTIATWIRVQVMRDGKQVDQQVWRYTGKRLAKVDGDWKSLLDALVEVRAPETTDASASATAR